MSQIQCFLLVTLAGILTILFIYIHIFLPRYEVESEETYESDRLNASDPKSMGTQKQDCKSLHFSKKPLPVTALFSYPGSGNTWIRHLLQQSTGEWPLFN